MATPLRTDMEAAIAAGQAVVFNGRIYHDEPSLPSQEEIDAVYSSGELVTSFSPDVVATIEDFQEVVEARTPAALDADGGIKVHLQNPEDIEGGGGGVGLTDAELRATPVPVADGGGSLTVDGTVAVSNHPTTTEVSNFPATQAVSAAALPLPTGASTSANQTTELASLASIDTKMVLPAALGSGSGLKVDIVGNTAAVGGAAAPAPVVAYSNQSITPNTETFVGGGAGTAISGRGYKGVRIRHTRTTSTSGATAIRVYTQSASGAYTSILFQSSSIASGDAGSIEMVIYPSITTAAGLMPSHHNGYVPENFKIAIFAGSAIAQTVYTDYQLLP